MINWKVRIRNKQFWIALIPALLLLVQVVAAVFGFKLDFGDLGNKLIAGVEKRLVADAKVGFLLSGGLDSSLVCAISQKLLKRPIRLLSDLSGRSFQMTNSLDST